MSHADMHHIYTELVGREKRSELQVYSLLSAGYNTDYSKLGERIREET